MRFFIVEDEPDIIEFYTEVIELCGHSVLDTAEDGAAAVAKYAAFAVKPDAVLMDHRMPVKTGIEAVREIMKLDPDAKIIFASADRSVEEEARGLGVVSFKKKPFTLERLESNIEKLENILCKS